MKELQYLLRLLYANSETSLSLVSLMKSLQLSSLFEILQQNSNLRSSDAEIQQRALEYFQLSSIATQDVLVCFITQQKSLVISTNLQSPVKNC